MSWLQTLQDQSKQLVDDLARLAEDATRLAQQGDLSGLLSSVVSIEEPAAPPVPLVDMRSVHVGRLGDEVSRMNADPDTYLTDDAADPQRYDHFCEHFRIDDYSDRIRRAFQQDDLVRRFHLQLVPAQLHNDLFWARYFYRLALLQAEDADRRALLTQAQHASATDKSITTPCNTAADVAWDSSDDDDDVDDKQPTTTSNTMNESAVVSTRVDPASNDQAGDQQTETGQGKPHESDPVSRKQNDTNSNDDATREENDFVLIDEA